MTKAEAKEAVKSNWRDLITEITAPAKRKVEGETTYICPFCGHGKNGDGLKRNPNSKDPYSLKCFGCEFSGDIIDLYEKYTGQNYNEVLRVLANRIGITIDNNTPPEAVKRPQSDFSKKADNSTIKAEEKDSKENKEPQAGQYREYITACAADADKTDYFKRRGFTSETIKRFMLGYDAEKKAIVIPYGKEGNYYITRSIEGKEFRKPKTSEAGSEPVFNSSALYADSPCFICESQLDAISIMQAGGNAAAVGGTGGEKLLKQVTDRKPTSPIILCFDRDTAGTEATQNIADRLKENGITFTEAQFTIDKYGDAEKKDANDLLKANSKQLSADVKQNIKAAQRKRAFIPYKVSEYLTEGGFNADISYFKKYKDRKTGFKNIDQYLTLYPGLAALGGEASLGKTTFCVNLADNLIKAGETILYFSLEQEPIEIVTKSLARRLYEKNSNTPINNIDIKNGATSAELETVKKEYAAAADRFIIVRCNFTTTAEDIRGYVEQFIKQTGTRPIVFIDYLQLLSAPADFKGDVRAATDNTIKTFKTMQLDNELLVILISNFNRSGYETPASYSDFKETGMIEYTCDYIWALQLSLLEDNSFYTKKGERGGEHETDVKTKSDKVHDAITGNPKEVEFVSLKSRNGKQSYKAFFRYYMQYDCFIPDLTSKYDNSEATGEFESIDKSPFDDIEYR